MSKTYDILKIGEHCYSSYEAERHQIDEHNNLHLLDENYEDIIVFKSERWDWFRINKEGG